MVQLRQVFPLGMHICPEDDLGYAPARPTSDSSVCPAAAATSATQVRVTILSEVKNPSGRRELRCARHDQSAARPGPQCGGEGGILNQRPPTCSKFHFGKSSGLQTLTKSGSGALISAHRDGRALGSCWGPMRAGVAQEELKKYDDALKSFKESVRLKSDNPLPWERMGLARIDGLLDHGSYFF